MTFLSNFRDGHHGWMHKEVRFNEQGLEGIGGDSAPADHEKDQHHLVLMQKLTFPSGSKVAQSLASWEASPSWKVG